jgi:hypothetical protein
MPILTTAQAINISDVNSVVITEIAVDEETGDYVREIRIFGEVEHADKMPDINQTATPAPLLLSLRVSSQSRNKIHISVPASEF